MKLKVSLKVRPGRGFVCTCRVCGREAKAFYLRDELGKRIRIECPKCKDNYVIV